MGKKVLLVLPVVLILTSTVTNGFPKHHPPSERTMDPLVSTEWLENNLSEEDLVIIDVRTADEYAAGHIQKAFSVPFEVPFSAWITMRDDLLLELPGLDQLFDLLGSLGIQDDSRVVVVTSAPTPPAPPYPLANATRVADTLIYLGVSNVAILDGGYAKWAAENRPVTLEVPDVNPVVYSGRVQTGMFVSTEYVERHKNRAVILDARDPDVYFGVTIEPWAGKAGHIPGARSLPTPWMWNRAADGSYDGTYRDAEVLGKMASGVIEKHRGKEIIVYCGVGGYASSWWFVLTQVLGYRNVKFYDGSAQEWVKTEDMIPYRWE
jgi:thiosulfate/3-mercaptopyruvate sulfurtransferase